MNHNPVGSSNEGIAPEQIEVAPLPQAAITACLPTQEVRPCETLLLVEDDAKLRQLTSRILHARGYIVLTAENAEEAIRAFEHCDHPIDLLITDFSMPGLSGCELAFKLAKREPGLKALFISGYDTQLIKPEALECNFAYLQKPFSLEALANKVREVIDGTTYPPEAPRIN